MCSHGPAHIPGNCPPRDAFEPPEPLPRANIGSSTPPRAALPDAERDALLDRILELRLTLAYIAVGECVKDDPPLARKYASDALDADNRAAAIDALSAAATGGGST